MSKWSADWTARSPSLGSDAEAAGWLILNGCRPRIVIMGEARFIVVDGIRDRVVRCFIYQDVRFSCGAMYILGFWRTPGMVVDGWLRRGSKRRIEKQNAVSPFVSEHIPVAIASRCIANDGCICRAASHPICQS